MPQLKGKFSHTCYRDFSLELVSVYRQSAHRWLFKSSPGGRLPLLSTRPAVTFPAKNVTVLRPVPSYTACWQRHIGVNNLHKVVTLLCPGRNWTHDLFITSPTLYRYATAPSVSQLLLHTYQLGCNILNSLLICTVWYLHLSYYELISKCCCVS